MFIVSQKLPFRLLNFPKTVSFLLVNQKKKFQSNRVMAQYKIVLVRHGESEWNLENRFCGWHDADLSAKGIEEAKQAGKVK